MKKIEIDIESCTYCPKRNGIWCTHPEIDGKKVSIDRVIPDWCPLPDVEVKHTFPMVCNKCGENYISDYEFPKFQMCGKCLDIMFPKVKEEQQ